MEPWQEEIKLIHERLNRQANAIKTLFQMVESLTQEPVTPQNPELISFSNNVLTFKLSNVKYLEFVDVEIDEEKWEQFWASWTDREPKFEVNNDVVTLNLQSIPCKSIQIFTRYDKFTKNSDAGHLRINL